jgi:hypothetical protein
MEQAEAGHAAADQVRMAQDVTTSPADFAAGLQPCPPAALPLPQALGRLPQQTGLPPRLRPSQLALSLRRHAILIRVVLRRPPASYRLFVYVTERRRRFTLRPTGIGIIFVYVTRRRGLPTASAATADISST